MSPELSHIQASRPTAQERGYVSKEGRALRSESLGRVLAAFLESYFPAAVDYGFTCDLEQQLDDVSGAS